MKKLMLFAGLSCLYMGLYAFVPVHTVKSDLSPVNASERAKAHFRNTYADAPDAAWYTESNQSIYCLFHQGKTIERVCYDKRGYWRYTLLSYPGEYLDKDLADVVMKEFADYRITYVNEIRSDLDEPVYIINIEDAGNIKVVKLIHGEIEVSQDLKKG